MEERLKLLLLKIIRDNGNIESLEKAGYQYATIAMSYSRLINEKYIEVNKNLEFVLAEKGYKELELLQTMIKKTGKWEIEPFTKYKIDKMNKYDIFIE